MRYPALAYLCALFVSAGCSAALPEAPFVGRYSYTAPNGGMRLLELHEDGSAAWTESTELSGISRNDGRYSVVGDSAYVTLQANKPDVPQLGMVASARGDSLFLIVAVQSMRVPLTLIRVR